MKVDVFVVLSLSSSSSSEGAILRWSSRGEGGMGLATLNNWRSLSLYIYLRMHVVIGTVVGGSSATKRSKWDSYRGAGILLDIYRQITMVSSLYFALDRPMFRCLHVIHQGNLTAAPHVPTRGGNAGNHRCVDPSTQCIWHFQPLRTSNSTFSRHYIYSNTWFFSLFITFISATLCISFNTCDPTFSQMAWSHFGVRDHTAKWFPSPTSPGTNESLLTLALSICLFVGTLK